MFLRFIFLTSIFIFMVQFTLILKLYRKMVIKYSWTKIYNAALWVRESKQITMPRRPGIQSSLFLFIYSNEYDNYFQCNIISIMNISHNDYTNAFFYNFIAHGCWDKQNVLFILLYRIIIQKLRSRCFLLIFSPTGILVHYIIYSIHQ